MLPSPMIRLRRLRDEKLLTIQELANHVGVTGVTIRNWEAGTHEPYARHKRELQKVFGMPIAEILADDEADNRTLNLLPGNGKGAANG